MDKLESICSIHPGQWGSSCTACDRARSIRCQKTNPKGIQCIRLPHADNEPCAHEDPFDKTAAGVTRSKVLDYTLVPRSVVDAVARRLELGIARGHERNNWRKGAGDEHTRRVTIGHLIKHLYDYLENGNLNEANTDAIACNAAFLCEYELHTPFRGERN